MRVEVRGHDLSGVNTHAFFFVLLIFFLPSQISCGACS